MSALAEINLWGSRIGAVSLDEQRPYASFEYDPAFLESGIQVSPLTMPLASRVYSFPGLRLETFHGLPGLLADSLPDKFGNALIDAWLATQGRTPASFNAVERLCYIGARGMGALEFVPALGPGPNESVKIQVDALVELASQILSQRLDLAASFRDDGERRRSLQTILRVGTSAGGARAKAVIAWNPRTNEVRSGQVPAGAGFEYWLLKFDGVAGNQDKELEDPKGYGVIEYAYSHMARAAGIALTETRLLEEHGRRHFMIKRFDRLADGEKLHMQSLAALAHYDFNQPAAYSYEQAFLAMRQLKLSAADIEQQYRRMVFNIVARNQDDHVKNIAFLMDRQGEWSLSPAFDVTYSFNPAGHWTAQHQMSMNGKRDGFALEDFQHCANVAGLKRGAGKKIVGEVTDVIAEWPKFADEAGVPAETTSQIARAHRLTSD